MVRRQRNPAMQKHKAAAGATTAHVLLKIGSENVMLAIEMNTTQTASRATVSRREVLSPASREGNTHIHKGRVEVLSRIAMSADEERSGENFNSGTAAQGSMDMTLARRMTWRDEISTRSCFMYQHDMGQKG